MMCRLLSSAIVLSVVGCAGPSTAPAEAPPTPLRGAHSCPLGVPGIVAIDDTADGATFTFTTSEPARVDDLRRRARDAAAGYGPGAHRGEGHEGEHGRGQHHGLRLSELPPVQASVDDVANGARIRVAAVDRSQADDVRAQLHAAAERAASGECP